MGVVQPQHAGMASGINSTFRQIGIATSVAVLGSIFDSKIGGATAATATGHYASALNEVVLIAACIAFAAGALALALIRRKDFHAPDPDPSLRPQTTTDPEIRLEQQMQLESRSVAILGGSAGIELATATLPAGRGAPVTIGGRDERRLADAASPLPVVRARSSSTPPTPALSATSSTKPDCSMIWCDGHQPQQQRRRRRPHAR